ncbi:hypothetical protein [Mycobacterium sp. shizuoka-1]|uniref:hypothetical protein n=1 Tax=Mycobacterium sp. shizuoka-1 TaxID=2039281 RepID=UPI000C063572|nr:hypothetical protein [Mycobacterium sp. shizuoka-1]GAY18856.1 hypothetical protein MSZK_55820 [Mycobacterium sp. shizuoka-1]
MNRTTKIRLAAFVAAPVAACGIFTGAFISGQSQSTNLADYGANVTAHIGMEAAQSAGVRHQHNGGQE